MTLKHKLGRMFSTKMIGEVSSIDQFADRFTNYNKGNVLVALRKYDCDPNMNFSTFP